ncbi:P-loop containing nucleoside triphosphate hydrolase protein [Naematelia encephala]|uniref:ATP-dependent RNA helicase n=1 Tax=Naematelia encephala TaxID=71784 RepID=A0A1Y2BM58_9TREE|nr:P-loop containing nucleoside triphosphate hydrolase protein [Naematelia encephala]
MAFVDNQASSSKPRRDRAKGKDRSSKPKLKSNQARRAKIDQELQELQSSVDNYEPPSEITQFSQLPLSSRTLKGLKSSHFVNPTPIQSLAIPVALRCRDVLGSARTGSGKTLAFLVPLLERLYLLKWGPLDGLGAVVISPTRELAVQTFTQLRDIGKYHSFSAGLVIGGKPLKEEQDRLGRMNILVATPGRLLQHLDSTVGFESAGVKVLVLDEADRLLDLGFLPALRAIVGHMSSAHSADGRPERQTMLFSATQSKDLAALAKLSLHEPLYINCNKPGEEGVVPTNLEQFYAVVSLDRKLDALWGFVKSHLKMKGVVFVTSGKQVRFIFETFRRLHPGLPLLHLHGKQKQPTRLDIFQRFSSSKAALLICTDVAARGLDFPAVDWVVQLDCPEDVDTYIHRVGRTARYEAEGKALLFLCPSEEKGMLTRLAEKSLEVKKIKIKESKMGNLKQQMQSFAFREPEIKYLGQRAFISYMRSVHLQKDKTIFVLSELPAEEYAASMGLPGAPQIKLSDKAGGKAKARGGDKKEEGPAIVHQTEVVASSDEGEEEVEDGSDVDSDDDGVKASSGEEEDSGNSSDSSAGPSKEASRPPAVRTKYDRMFERTNQSILTPHYTALVNQEADDDEDGDVFTLRRRDHDLEGDDDPEILKEDHSTPGEPLISSEDLSKRKLKSGTSRKAQLKNRPAPEKLVFDEEGHARDFYEHGKEAESGAGDEQVRRAFVEQERERMRAADKIDREVARDRKRELKRKRKEREREVAAGGDSDDEDGDEQIAVIGGGLEESEQEQESEPEPQVQRKQGKKARHDEPVTIEDEEELALRLLQGA